MQYLFSQAEDRFQLRDWGGYLCFLATADSADARKFGVTAIVRMDQLIHDPSMTTATRSSTYCAGTASSSCAIRTARIPSMTFRRATPSI